jgi:hypothetical protein
MHHFALLTSEMGLVSRLSPVQTALRNCTRDEGRSFEVGNQVLISSHAAELAMLAITRAMPIGSDNAYSRNRFAVRCRSNFASL